MGQLSEGLSCAAWPAEQDGDNTKLRLGRAALWAPEQVGVWGSSFSQPEPRPEKVLR